MSDQMFADEGVTTVDLTEWERQTLSVALSHFVDFCVEVPEVSLPQLQGLHSKFLMPQDIAA